MSVLVSRKVRAELDAIWSHIATESGSLEIADRAVDAITDTLLQLSRYPQLGRQRDDLRPGIRSLAVGSYLVIYRPQGNNVRILHVVHGSRNISSIVRN
jgi:toxin ParE1/3/4